MSITDKALGEPVDPTRAIMFTLTIPLTAGAATITAMAGAMAAVGFNMKVVTLISGYLGCFVVPAYYILATGVFAYCVGKYLSRHFKESVELLSTLHHYYGEWTSESTDAVMRMAIEEGRKLGEKDRALQWGVVSMATAGLAFPFFMWCVNRDVQVHERLEAAAITALMRDLGVSDPWVETELRPRVANRGVLVYVILPFLFGLLNFLAAYGAAKDLRAHAEFHQRVERILYGEGEGTGSGS